MLNSIVQKRHSVQKQSGKTERFAAATVTTPLLLPVGAGLFRGAFLHFMLHLRQKIYFCRAWQERSIHRR